VDNNDTRQGLVNYVTTYLLDPSDSIQGVETIIDWWLLELAVTVTVARIYPRVRLMERSADPVQHNNTRIVMRRNTVDHIT